MSLEITLRQACEADVEPLIELMLVSSWGGMQGAWGRVAPQGMDWRDQARAELLDLNCDLGLPNFVVAANGDEVVGMILFNFFDDMHHIQPERAGPELRETLSLLKKAAHSVFIREIAVDARARGQGVGRILLAFAEDLWRPHALDRLSLLVNSENTHAMDVYAGRGFVETARAPNSINHPSYSNASFKILMEKRKSWEQVAAEQPHISPAEHNPAG
jgi:ribosomal protein S18 acetylase RimI-like enzyme